MVGHMARLSTVISRKISFHPCSSFESPDFPTDTRKVHITNKTYHLNQMLLKHMSKHLYIYTSEGLTVQLAIQLGKYTICQSTLRVCQYRGA